MKKIKAFTLTEVLLTLAIIGVITAITVPSLMAQNHARKYQTMTKKAIYTLQAAVDAKYEQSTRKMESGNNLAFFGWLMHEGADPEGHPEDVIRCAKYQYASAANDRCQTADGIIFRAFEIGYSDAFKHGGRAKFMVDINGMEPPFQRPVTEKTGTSFTDEDIIFLEMDRYGTIKPITHNSNNNAMRYFDLSNFGL